MAKQLARLECGSSLPALVRYECSVAHVKKEEPRTPLSFYTLAEESLAVLQLSSLRAEAPGQER